MRGACIIITIIFIFTSVTHGLGKHLFSSWNSKKWFNVILIPSKSWLQLLGLVCGHLFHLSRHELAGINSWEREREREIGEGGRTLGINRLIVGLLPGLTSDYMSTRKLSSTPLSFVCVCVWHGLFVSCFIMCECLLMLFAYYTLWFNTMCVWVCVILREQYSPCHRGSRDVAHLL